MRETKVIIVAFLKQKVVSFEFLKWPNHITIVPYFRTRNPDKLICEIKKVCSNVPEIHYRIGATNYFGEGRMLKVSRIKNSSSLVKLHTSILKIALVHDKNVDTGFCYPNYNPHITHNNKPYPREGDVGVIKKVYIIKYLSLETKAKQILAIGALK